jgi:hypothetical protein
MTVSPKVVTRAKEDALFVVYLIREDPERFAALCQQITTDRQRTLAVITALAAAVPLDVAFGEAWKWTESTDQRSAA